MVKRRSATGRNVLFAATAAGLALVLSAPAAYAACPDWNPLDNRTVAGSRQITAGDLIGLANFGQPDAEPDGGPRLFAVSPDGASVAAILQRADLAGNDYCQALILIDLKGQTAPRILDRGGGYLMATVVFRSMYIPNGFPRLNPPAWSADGRSVAYLRRDDGRTQLWRVRIDGGAAAPVTHGPVDVDVWSWGEDGKSLVYSAAPGRIEAEAAIAREGASGWHYDERTAPNMGLRPQISAPLPSVVSGLDPDTGALIAVTAGDRRRLELGGDDPPDRRRTNAKNDAGWVERDGPSPFASSRLHAVDARGTPYSCVSAACTGHFRGLWWDAAGRHLTFLKMEGWNNRYAALYRWSPGRGAPRRILRTDDDLGGCVPAGDGLACVRETATHPPRLVVIERAKSAERLVFDPNPGFDQLTLGSVRRFEWRNAIGNEVYGDLVLPPGYRGEARLPTIVVQYSSRGFLRGGTGNEYPIFLLAARGFAVLGIQGPRMFAASQPGISNYDAIATLNTRDWAERRNVHSAIERGVQRLVADGIADPAKLGITGLSDGASAVRFALINSTLFAAASLSSCCVDEFSDALVGPGWDRYSRRIGYPPAAPVDTDFWKPYSLAVNAARMRTPLLMQLADGEMLMGLPAFTALRAYGQPVDLYSFPDEFHAKWQPQHRRAVFERNLDWFSFWLQGREDPAPAKADQFALWRGMRDRLRVPSGSTP